MINEYPDISYQGRKYALDMLNQYYCDSEKPDIIIEIHCGNLSKQDINYWCNYYTKFWNNMNKSSTVVTTPTVCRSYGNYYIFFTKIRRDLVF